MAKHKLHLMAKFYAAILLDGRIHFTHIALYMAFVQHLREDELTGGVHISRKKVMQYSKIKSIATYHRCVRELQQYGYIEYRPSYHPSLGSLVYFKTPGTLVITGSE